MWRDRGTFLECVFVRISTILLLLIVVCAGPTRGAEAAARATKSVATSVDGRGDAWEVGLSGDKDRARGPSAGALSSGNRVVLESLAPRRKKTHVVEVNVDALASGEGVVVDGFEGIVRKVRGAWMPRYVRLQCLDDAGAWVGMRVYRGDGAGGRERSAWCGWPYAVYAHVDRVGQHARSNEGSNIAEKREGAVQDMQEGPWCWVGLPGGVLRLEAAGRTASTTLRFFVEYVHELSWVRVGAYVLGALVFVYAPVLARSTAFRLTAGSCGGIALSAMLVLFVVWRNVPHKRSMAAVVAMWGGAAAVLWKVVSAVHAGAFDRARVVELMVHPLVVGYVVASGLVGMAVTYYMHDSRNEKMNTIVQVGLQLGGVGLMVGSATSWVGGAVWGGMVVVRTVMGGWRKRNKERREDGGEGGEGRERTWERGGVGGLKEGADQEMHTPRVARRALRVALPDSPDEDPGNIVGCIDQARTTPRSEPLTPTVFRVSTTHGVPPSPADFPESERGRLHGLVRRGKILNVETDRTIVIGKGKYNELYLKGYEVNFESGEITPPSMPSQGSR